MVIYKAIKHSLLAGIFLTVLGGLCYAKTMFVSDNFEITMRSGPGVERKILALIRSGQAVEVLTANEEWTEIRLPSNKQGWVLTRYLTDNVPCTITLEDLTTKYDALVNQKDILDNQYSELSNNNQGIESQLASTRKELTELTKKYEALKKGSKDYLSLKATHTKTVKELSEVKSKAEKFEDETNRLLRNQNIKWFLIGAAVLLLGIIIGFSSRRPKRRSSLL
jgi:SH3 domain protein